MLTPLHGKGLTCGWRGCWSFGLNALLVCAVTIPFMQAAGQSQSQNPDKPYLIPEANRLPDANAQMKMHQQQSRKNNFEAANAERKRQICDDANRLLALAKELKTEVDKTDKDTLSLSVMRKAETIEKLAHGVKEKMKLTVGGS